MELRPDLINLTKAQTVAGTFVGGVRQPELTADQRRQLAELNSH